MIAKTFIVLDTNILMRFVTQGTPGCEEVHWNDLLDIGKRQNVTFLVPETVALEFEKVTDDLAGQINLQYEKMRQCLPKAFADKTIWNEVKDTESLLLEKLGQLEEEKLNEWTKRRRQVERWIASGAITKLPLDSDIILRTKKRMISGKYPASGTAKDKRLVENDCYIIDSVIRFFETKSAKTNRLLICTENFADFGIDIKDEHTNNVHPKLRAELPDQTRIFLSLSKLVKFFRKQENVKMPKATEVRTALDEEKARQVSVDAAFTEAMRRSGIELGISDVPLWLSAVDSSAPQKLTFTVPPTGANITIDPLPFPVTGFPAYPDFRAVRIEDLLRNQSELKRTDRPISDESNKSDPKASADEAESDPKATIDG